MRVTCLADKAGMATNASPAPGHRLPGPVTRFLAERVGRRGAALLFFALLDAVYAVSLLAPDRTSRRTATTLFVDSVAPLWVWGLLWAAAGVVCLAHAFRMSDRVGFAAAIAIKTVWGLLFVFAGFAGVSRAYVGAAIFLCMAVWVAIISSWPEPPPAYAIPGGPGYHHGRE